MRKVTIIGCSDVMYFCNNLSKVKSTLPDVPVYRERPLQQSKEIHNFLHTSIQLSSIVSFKISQAWQSVNTDYTWSHKSTPNGKGSFPVASTFANSYPITTHFSFCPSLNPFLSCKYDPPQVVAVFAAIVNLLPLSYSKHSHLFSAIQNAVFCQVLQPFPL